MAKELELPKGMRVLVEVDVKYIHGRLDPFQFHFKSKRYGISRILRRQTQKHDGREMKHFRTNIEGQKGTYELIQDVKSALWTLRKIETAR